MALHIVLKHIDDVLREEGVEHYEELGEPRCHELMAFFFDGKTPLRVRKWDGADSTALVEEPNGLDFWVVEHWVKEAI